MVNDRQSLDLTTFARPADGGAVGWQVSHAPVPYLEAVAAMEVRVAAIAAGEAPELVWLLEHPPLYTSGTSGKADDLLDARFPLFVTGRGGQLTYHGPGQRVAYVAPDLTHFDAIVPCGVVDPRYGVTSLADLGHPATMADVDIALRRAFEEVFGSVQTRLPEPI